MFLAPVEDRNASTPTPFGNATFDGIDLDLRSLPAGADLAYWYQFLIDLRSLMRTASTGKSYLFSASPTCNFPDPYFGPGNGSLVSEFAFDILNVRYYDDPTCSVNNLTTFTDWENQAAYMEYAGASTRAFFGVLMGNTTTSGWSGYDDLLNATTTLGANYSSNFGGLVFWDLSSAYSMAQPNTTEFLGQEIAGAIRNETRKCYYLPTYTPPSSPTASTTPGTTETLLTVAPLSTGAIIGISVAGGALVLGGAGYVASVFYRKRRREQANLLNSLNAIDGVVSTTILLACAYCPMILMHAFFCRETELVARRSRPTSGFRRTPLLKRATWVVHDRCAIII